jgi:hypothetical protein
MPGDAEANDGLDFQQYAVVSQRRNQWDALIWQVAALGFAAQAFLFTIALGGDTTRTARILASLLALVVSACCVQLMGRHRLSEAVDAHWLVKSDADHRLEPVHGAPFDAKLEALRRSEEFLEGEPWRKPVVWAARFRSTNVWMLAMTCFGVVAAASLVLAIVKPSLLSGVMSVPFSKVTGGSSVAGMLPVKASWI